MTTTIQEGPTLADELLERIGTTVGDRARVSTVFGEPVRHESVTVIPVGKARFAFGGGGGAGEREGNHGSGGGGGGGAVVSPLGYIEIREGGARFKRIRRPSDLLALAGAASLVALAAIRLSAAIEQPRTRAALRRHRRRPAFRMR
jgi:uncharacterized spore protein YtfJ